MKTPDKTDQDVEMKSTSEPGAEEKKTGEASADKK